MSGDKLKDFVVSAGIAATVATAASPASAENIQPDDNHQIKTEARTQTAPQKDDGKTASFAKAREQMKKDSLDIGKFEINPAEIGSFEIKGNSEEEDRRFQMEGEILKAKEIIREEMPKEEEWPLSREEYAQKQADQYFKGLESCKDKGSMYFLWKYKEACKANNIDCPDIQGSEGPVIRYTSPNTVEASRLPDQWKDSDYKDYIDIMAVNISNKYRRIYGDTPKAKTLAGAEFTAVSQVMAKNGITPDSPVFRQMASLRCPPVFTDEKENRGRLGDISKFIETKAKEEKQATAAKQQTQTIALNKSNGRE